MKADVASRRSRWPVAVLMFALAGDAVFSYLPGRLDVTPVFGIIFLLLGLAMISPSSRWAATRADR